MNIKLMVGESMFNNKDESTNCNKGDVQQETELRFSMFFIFKICVDNH